MTNHLHPQLPAQWTALCWTAAHQVLTQVMCDIKAVLGNTGREAQQLGPRESAKGERKRRNGPWRGAVGQGGGEQAQGSALQSGAPGGPGCGASSGQKEH